MAYAVLRTAFLSKGLRQPPTNVVDFAPVYRQILQRLRLKFIHPEAVVLRRTQSAKSVERSDCDMPVDSSCTSCVAFPFPLTSFGATPTAIGGWETGGG
jgi:hypothetical protein